MKRPTVASLPDRSTRPSVMEQGIRCENRVYGMGEGRLHLFYETTHSPSPSAVCTRTSFRFTGHPSAHFRPALRASSLPFAD